MKKNYTVMFLMFFVASIAGGVVLKNIFDYSMIVGVGLGTVVLLCSAFFAGKKQKIPKAQ
ncbi:hypothetical protein [Neobacillus sp. SuZ13]|uniref:hypothetical protein n=1 Tax=Neobacillus sp. SuZ13 TaxID=3047875 RepID=UPI0024BF5907|nr:hypothetical protein [Neobacillus sp. SuZ13]WHY69603.1 hypothetical protein QNH17_13625 [Neobacillus sp. SuZ13]